MDYSLKPSLEYIALIKVVGTLWNKEDIRDLIEKFCTPFNSTELKKEWPKIEERVKGKVPQLALPESFKEKIESIIKPIGFQILRWMKYHGDIFLNVHLPGDFHWTLQGTIDERGLAEMLIKDESIDIFTRYKMSCIYCLENDILKLWNKIPEVCKKSFYSAEDPTLIKQPELVILWTYDIKGEVRKLQHTCSPYQYAFEIAANDGNKVAFRHFLKKLTSRERKESLIRTAVSVAYMHCVPSNKHTGFLYKYYSDILCNLLMHMNEEQQMHIFINFPYHVLNCFLDWPWQFFFAKTFKHMGNFLPTELYGCLLEGMINKVIKGYKDFNYQKLFAENWQEIPDAYKRSVFKNFAGSSYLIPKLFNIRDENNIKLIFKDATIADKKNFFMSYGAENMRDYLIDCEEWGLLRLHIQLGASSKSEMIKFKQNFQKYKIQQSSKEKQVKMKNKWNKFLSILDDIISCCVDENVDR